MNKKNLSQIIIFIVFSLVFPMTYSQTLPIVKVNFVFATNHSAATKYDHAEQMKKELSILNQYFVDEQEQKIFDFKLNKYLTYDTFNNKNCKLSQILEQPKTIEHSTLISAFNMCFYSQPQKSGLPEVYLFIFDAYAPDAGFKSTTSWGFSNAGKPLILIDWERLNYNIQAAVPHEMGHAFGLRHVCIKNAKTRDNTNIMASRGNCDGSGGLRNQGFNQEQVKIILKNYQAIKESQH